MSINCTCLSHIDGAEFVQEFVVGPTDFAAHLGSGDLKVLGTPRLIAWMESVTVTLLEQCQSPECTSVGVHIDIRHLAPSIEGDRVQVAVRVHEVSGSKIHFAVTATSAGTTLAEGVITRAHVNREKFIHRLGGR